MKNLTKLFALLTLLVAFFTLTSCSDDDDDGGSTGGGDFGTLINNQLPKKSGDDPFSGNTYTCNYYPS